MLALPYTLLTALLLAAPQDPPPTPRNKPPAPTEDPVIAKLDDREIKLSDLIDEVNRQIPLNYYHRRVPAEQMASFQREAFDKIVVKHLIHLDGLAAGLEVTEAEIRKDFDAALQEAGPEYANLKPPARDSLFAEVRPTLVRRTLIRKNEERLAARVPKVEEKMVRSIYDERLTADPTAFQAPKESHFHHIFVAIDPSRIRTEEEQKKAKIEMALAELEQGKPFATVARLYSEDEFAAKGGDLGYQKADSFRLKQVSDQAFAMAKGQTSEIIRSLHGFHLLHCVDVKPARNHTFEEMRPVIEAWLAEEHLKLARGRWLAGLREKYPLTMLRPDLLEAAPDKSDADDQGDKDKSDKKAPSPAAHGK